ncbi:hypothetical protein [Mesorhizobium sp.]|nr:hypothetical protein [Mesorhizobium sp.]
MPQHADPGLELWIAVVVDSTICRDTWSMELPKDTQIFLLLR